MNYVECVQRAIEYIEEHLDEELNLSSIAEEAFISVAQLYRVFYALTGHPVKDYIRMICNVLYLICSQKARNDRITR
ncbi:MAG: hypothetical protein K0Q73_7944 [Paenibacillus sp.]|nr:hypothetical protein [Paenibacillus sp.]